MSFVKSIAYNFAAAAAVLLGMGVAGVVWDAGLDDLVEEKAKKLFSKKEKES